MALSEKSPMDERKVFHDALRNGRKGQRWSLELEKLIQKDSLWANMKYYAIERKSREVVIDWFERNCWGKRVLDYCCGNGDDSFIIVKKGAAEVFGIDLSDISVANCRERALKEGLDSKTKFHVMDAEALSFGNSYFDVVTEYGALHHLNLGNAYSEIARVLRPDGKCICVETLGHNPIIHYYRKKTPDLRTEWEVEHILCKKDIDMAKSYFKNIDILGFFHLATLAAVPFRNTNVFNVLLSVLEVVDSALLKLPVMKWQAWQVVFTLSVPLKTEDKGVRNN